MSSRFLQAVYESYASGDQSFVRRLHLRFLGSPLFARLLFGVTVERGARANYFDLTTLLLKRLVKQKLRERPDRRLLEIGVGAYAILSGCASTWATQTIDAVDNLADRVESAQRHAAHNRLDLRIWESDLFEQITYADYDLIFWNLPYYRDPESFLPTLFARTPDHLTDGGELVIGFNTKPLPRAKVLSYSESHARRLAHVETITYPWNLHDLLVFRKVS